jgi:8-oxo-dGTP diphosphatase
MVHLTKCSTFENRKKDPSPLTDIKKQVHEHYGNRIRVRACGVLIQNGKILMLKHEGIGKQNFYWSVPGGEPVFEENLSKAVEREYEEEVQLAVKAGELLYINEYIEKPLHAIELYFKVAYLKGKAKLGHDPESAAFKVLSDMNWFTKAEVLEMSPETRPHFLEHIWY